MIKAAMPKDKTILEFIFSDNNIISRKLSELQAFKNPAAIATGLQSNINTQIAAFIIFNFLPVKFPYFSSIPDTLSPGPPPAVYPLLSPVFHFETQKEYKSPLFK